MDQTAEHSMQLRHQQRRGYAFSGCVSHQKEQFSAGTWNDVAIVAAHRTHGLVMMGDLPIAEALLARRKQSGLHVRSQNQILFQCATFLAAEMIYAETDEGI